MLRGTGFGRLEVRVRVNRNIIKALPESPGLSQGSANRSQPGWKLQLSYELGLEKKRSGDLGYRGKTPGRS